MTIEVSKRSRRKCRGDLVALVAAVAKFGTDNVAIGEALGITPNYVNLLRRRHGLGNAPSGFPVRLPALKPFVPPPSGRTVWTPEVVQRLRAAAERDPRPSNAEIAIELGSTKDAIDTAMWRYGISKGTGGSRDRTGFSTRSCMTCTQPFLSEGIHNRRCSPCKSEDSCSVAA